VVSSKIGHSLDPYLLKTYSLVFKNKSVNPNVLTISGAFFGLLASACVVFNQFLLAGFSLFVSGFFDMLDGAVARSLKKATVFGGFLDSVLDRYTDLLVMGAILFFYMKQNYLCYASVAFVAVVGTAIIPYARARGEAAGVQCRSGLMERPERTVLLLIGLFVPLLLSWVMLILAFLTHITVIQRIIHVRRAIKNTSFG